MKQKQEEAARKERKEKAATLIGSPGWTAMQEEINSLIEQNTRLLVSMDFKDLQDVAKLQAEIRAYKKVFDFPINDSK